MNLRRVTPQDLGHEPTGMLCPSCEKHELGRSVSFTYAPAILLPGFYHREERLVCACGFSKGVSFRALTHSEWIEERQAQAALTGQNTGADNG